MLAPSWIEDSDEDSGRGVMAVVVKSAGWATFRLILGLLISVVVLRRLRTCNEFSLKVKHVMQIESSIRHHHIHH